jgi:hypothetical protein
MSQLGEVAGHPLGTQGEPQGIYTCRGALSPRGEMARNLLTQGKLSLAPQVLGFQKTLALGNFEG